MNTPKRLRPVLRAGLFLGIGLGGFVDGILFHQILQVHGMLTGRLPKDSIVNIETNMFWDGMFHAMTWLMTLVGVILLFRAGRSAENAWSGRALAGGMIGGWGLFNTVEGIVDHHILNLHHVVESRGQSVFDWLFLASGALMLVIGWMVMRASERHRDRSAGVGNLSPPEAARPS